MSILEAQRRISKQVFFSEKRLGEKITYNDKEVIALVYIGADMQRTDWGDTATAIENARIADMAVFSVCDDLENANGVERPQEGDLVEYKGLSYEVTQLVKHDVAGAHYVVVAAKNGRVRGR